MEEKQKNKNILYLNCKTYLSPKTKQLVGLFIRNEPQKTREENLFIRETKFLYRTSSNKIKDYKGQNESKKEDENITKVKIRKGDFFLVNTISKSLYKLTIQDINNIQNQLWYVMNLDEKAKKENNTNQNEDYYLCEGDIIKLGTELYILRKINILNNNINEGNKETKYYDIHSLNCNQSIIFDLYTEPKVLDENNFCSHIINDLKDSKKITILKQKIENEKRKNIKKNVKSYRFYLHKCNECNKTYPLRFKLSENSEVIDLISIDIPKDKNYIILESIKIDILEIYVIELTGKDEEFTIGRKDENDIVINKEYKTISRNHAVIKYVQDKGQLLLRDRSNYAGTMVLIKKELKLSEKKEIYLQAGRTFIMAKLINEDDYNKEKEKIDNQEKEKEKKIQDEIKKLDEKESYKEDLNNEFYYKK